MKISRIPKGNGKFRTIYVPDKDEKAGLRMLLPQLNDLCEKKVGNCAHGFVVGRNPVTNAMPHIGYDHTLSFDLQDFFDHVGEKHLKGEVPANFLETCLVDGAARQGLPTSPALSNIAASKMDRAIIRALKKNVGKFAYTRYADDLSISFNEYSHAPVIEKIVKQTVSRSGFVLNTLKTKLQWARNGRRIITGIAVDDKGVHPPRWLLRKLRAAKHQKNHLSAQGLAESAKCKIPNPDKNRKLWIFDALISMGVKISKEDAMNLPDKKTEWLDGNTLITGDPVYIAGISKITTGWKSCMSPGKSRYQGVRFYLALKGARVAATLSDKAMIVGGKRYRKMINRAIVFDLRDGTSVFSKIYGNNTNSLETKLIDHGLIPAFKKRGVKVKGNVPAKTPTPYLDKGMVSGGKVGDKKVRFIRL